MNKSDLIENIRTLNPTASIEFLNQFEELELQDYMDHLSEVSKLELSETVPVTPFH